MSNESGLTPNQSNSTPPDDDRVPSLRALARRLGVHHTTVAGWIERGCPGPNEEGEYSLGAVEVWLGDRVARRVDSDELTAEYAELIRARADEREHLAALAECELRELRAKYVSADWVRRRAAWQERIVRRELAAMIDRLAPRLVGLDEVTARAAFKDEARRTLNAIATATG